MLSDWGSWLIFLFGITAAHIVHIWPRIQWIHKSGPINVQNVARNWFVSVLPIVGLLIIYFMQYKPYGVPQYVVSLGILLLFIYGNSLFGLLNTRAARFLGTISYSVYLMHGIILFAVLDLANAIVPIPTLTPMLYWSLILLTAILTVLVSSITYKYIEHPFLKKK